MLHELSYIHLLSTGLNIATRSYLASLQYRPNELREFWMQRLVSCFEFLSSHQYRRWSETVCAGFQLHSEENSRSYYWSQTASTKEHRCICRNSVCWFTGRRHSRSAGLLTSCLVVNRCRLSSMQKRGFAVLDRLRGTICQRLYTCFDSQEQ